MTRSDVKKLAWRLRLVGCGLLVGAFALMFVGAGHAAAKPGRLASVSEIR